VPFGSRTDAGLAQGTRLTRFARESSGVPDGIRKYVEAETGRDYAETYPVVTPSDRLTPTSKLGRNCWPLPGAKNPHGCGRPRPTSNPSILKREYEPRPCTMNGFGLFQATGS